MSYQIGSNHMFKIELESYRHLLTFTIDFHLFLRQLRHDTGMRSKNREKNAPNRSIEAFAVEFCAIPFNPDSVF